MKAPNLHASTESEESFDTVRGELIKKVGNIIKDNRPYLVREFPWHKSSPDDLWHKVILIALSGLEYSKSGDWVWLDTIPGEQQSRLLTLYPVPITQFGTHVFEKEYFFWQIQ